MPAAACSTEIPSGSATRSRTPTARGLGVERQLARRGTLWIDVAEAHGRVGHRRLDAAAAVADRPGDGAGALRADA